MTPGDHEWTQEAERLERTLREIARQTKVVEATLGQHRSEVISARADMWENMPRLVRSWDDIVELNQNQQLLDQRERSYLLYAKMLPILRRLADSPYFGRIDFAPALEPAGEPVQVYIGISGLTSETGEHLIFDWRAPISSMFYDFEPGPASYAAQGGRIEGEMLLKRQYKIEHGVLRYMFDTDLKIDDDLLQEILSKSADNKMRVIVQSIQREQNRAIRDEDHRLLIVQGPAGSGKTSIALHRVAYFLYRYRGDLRADQVLVLSPNELFSDYISDVLPELGEENVVQKTFRAYVDAWLDIEAESLADHMEFLLGQDGAASEVRKAGIEFKGSLAFLRILQNYVRHLESGAGTPFEDVLFRGEVVVTRETLVELFRNQYSYLPYGKRLDKAARRALFLIEPFEEKRLREIREALKRESDPDNEQGLSREMLRLSNRLVREETAPLKQRLQAWGQVDWTGIYRALFADLDLLRSLAGELPLPREIAGIARQTVESIDRGLIGYEDAAPALYLKAALGGVEAMSHIRHVVVDESQDYSPVHYMAMRTLFPNAAFTILGDVNQAIHPRLNATDAGVLERIFAGLSSAVIRMATSYRSTREIVAFTKAILPECGPIKPIDRSGEKPLLIEASDERSAALAIARTVQSLKGEGYRSIAVICKTANDAFAVRQLIGDRCEARLVTKNDRRFARGAVIIPSYLAKGLEFDAVVIHDAGKGRYAKEEERKLLYTACTRALHRLVLYSIGEPSPLLASVPPELYTAAEIEPAR